MVERADRQRGHDLAVRFGGSLTGVGIAAGVASLLGSQSAFTAGVSTVLLLVGITLLVTGYLLQHKDRQ